MVLPLYRLVNSFRFWNIDIAVRVFHHIHRVGRILLLIGFRENRPYQDNKYNNQYRQYQKACHPAIVGITIYDFNV